MAILSEGDRVSWVEIQGRHIKLYAVDQEQGIQSINVCDARNLDGEYEEVQYFKAGNHLTAQQVDGFGDLAAFKVWLRELAYQQARDA